MRALLTGASGFVGQSVVAHLNAVGVEIVALTRRQQPPMQGVEWQVLESPSNSGQIAEAVSKVAPDVVFHLAGTSDGSNLSALYEANVVFAAQVFEACLAVPASPVVVVAGSAAEYGPVSNDVARVSESFHPNPNTAYGISKLAQTQHAMLAASRGLRIIVARLFNPIGPNMPVSLALGSFAEQIAQFETTSGVLRTGDLDSERDFIDVDEVARILFELTSIDRAYGSIVNVCTGKASNLMDLTTRLIQLAGIPVRIERDPSRIGNSTVRRFVGDPSRLNSFGIGAHTTNLDALLASMLATARERCHNQMDLHTRPQ
ncbi:NAD-dependent epimerase/dehydratase family protein [Burkholderia ubonensis]|uniref:NAD-dependent epimerase/dehydratase family protein n=1 Tax=Burkholderia ubonensis TaxID=101571 RepID=UPI0009B45FC0|nr:NAD-dependent epimerase/dehydratase family protein [Burkholderia ubonensis]